jgi:hypothetical protein
MVEPNAFPTPAQRRALLEVFAAFPSDWTTVRDDPDGHRQRLEAVGRNLDPDFTTEGVGGGFKAAVGRGIDGWLRFWGDWLAGFEEFRAETEGIVDADDRMIGLIRQWGIPKGGRRQIENAAAAVFWFRGDRIDRIQLYLHRDEALRDAGIDPADARASSRS